MLAVSRRSLACVWPHRWLSTTADGRREQARKFKLLTPAMQAFIAARGHCVVPFHYPIPSSDAKSSSRVDTDGKEKGSIVDWPEETRGLNLGRTLHAFVTNERHQERYPHVVTSLRAIGVPIGVDWQQYVWEKVVMTAIKTFYALEGHSIVPIAFVIPWNDSQWPRETWGYRLGWKVSDIRHEPEVLDEQALVDLERMEFSFDVSETTWRVQIRPSLETFFQLNGHCHVRADFIVPSELPWPKEAWGFSLGNTVERIRLKGNYAKQIANDGKFMEEIGFVRDVNEHNWRMKVRPSLKMFAQLNGHCLVRADFIVPSELPWPKEAWGFPLGSTVQSIRSRGNYAKQIANDEDFMKEIGFVWRVMEPRKTQ
ncbi:hypothetical protein Poli38472_012758 [Pythium oligandrum]|uniref:Helicase-associated domain-containing protein n=1 Tax=Pythium oligandrum TaxID=41045 RepID=A0A8K1CE12_PYTOL|nr:hypothetical protein Poli38472_012758 [Pythium oligandrum]|eukprot:TMW61567.1 hypothetical protein Poli38472_012758 [Pythium oligandrum]